MLMLSDTSGFIKHYKSIMKVAHINCTLFSKCSEGIQYSKGTPKKGNKREKVKAEE